MGIIIRQSFFSTTSAYFGVLIGYANAIILMPLFMTPDEIGLFRTVMSIAMLLVSLVMFGMGGAIVRYYPLRGSTPKALNELFTFSFVVVSLFFIFIALLFYFGRNLFFDFFQENSSEVNNYLGLILLVTLQMGVFNLVEIIFRTQREIILPNVIRDILYKSLHVVIVLAYGYELIPFDTYLKSHALIYVLLIVALGLPMILRFRIKFDFGLFREIGGIKEILTYGFIGILSGLGMTIVIQIDQIMVTKYLGLAANGVYSTALFMAVVIEYPRRFISQISYPIMAEDFANKNYAALNEHYKKASINQLILGILIFLGIVINLENIYGMMPNGAAYQDGFWVVVIYGLVKLVDMGFSLNGEIISLSKYYKYNTVFIVFLTFLTIMTNLWLIPKFGIIGAALATMISYLIFNIFKYIMLKVKFGFEPFNLKTILLLLVFGVCVIAHLLLPSFANIYLDIIIRSAMITVIYIFATYFINISELFNELLEKMLPFIKKLK